MIRRNFCGLKLMILEIKTETARKLRKDTKGVSWHRVTTGSSRKTFWKGFLSISVFENKWIFVRLWAEKVTTQKTQTKRISQIFGKLWGAERDLSLAWRWPKLETIPGPENPKIHLKFKNWASNTIFDLACVYDRLGGFYSFFHCFNKKSSIRSLHRFSLLLGSRWSSKIA